jgi:threonine/homoserine/homoserine lactone efflux protein
MSIEIYLAFLLTTIVIIIVPGPTVTLVIGNSLTHGARAGLLNVAGNQAGKTVLVAVVIVGLASLIETMGWWFEWVRLAGAAYLIWIGIKLLRSAGRLGDPQSAPAPRGGFFLQGLLVGVSNPKTLAFFGALFPQFIDPSRDYLTQVLIMGGTALVVAAISDSIYAVLVGSAGRRLSRKGMKWLSRISGGCVIGGGLWLALSRSR